MFQIDDLTQTSLYEKRWRGGNDYERLFTSYVYPEIFIGLNRDNFIVNVLYTIHYLELYTDNEIYAPDGNDEYFNKKEIPQQLANDHSEDLFHYLRKNIYTTYQLYEIS